MERAELFGTLNTDDIAEANRNYQQTTRTHIDESQNGQAEAADPSYGDTASDLVPRELVGPSSACAAIISISTTTRSSDRHPLHPP
jgi:hypothetical protein